MNCLIAFLLGLITAVTAAPQFGQPLKPQPFQQYPQTAPAQPQIHRQQPSGEALARILRLEQDTQFDGSFNYAYQTENGISGQAQGQLKNPGTEQEAQVITGSYSWTAPDGTPISITFIADEGGFRAEGDAIPTPPPIPEAIARALDYIKSLPPQPERQK